MDAIVYVVEDHEVVKQGKAVEPCNTLVLLDAKTGEETLLASDADFFAAPSVSPDGTLLAWIQWHHPQMPWWNTQLCVAKINDQKQVNIIITRQNRSNMMPSFDRGNSLYYVHDQTGWWNLYKITDLKVEVNLTPESKEVGWPMWQFGWRAYAVNPKTDNEVVAVASHELMVVEIESHTRRSLPTGYAVHLHGVVYSKDGTQTSVLSSPPLLVRCMWWQVMEGGQRGSSR
ncbi:hypothetical protein OTU49_006434 [Cherax quadricarinatus]|uniref:Dipeptidylpeptidase IV N-terminal domain-containing protein n=1 Tax=Cherax quadricarinatus TaxID=27406 RepID=A0AAW0X2K5_CHEQU